MMSFKRWPWLQILPFAFIAMVVVLTLLHEPPKPAPPPQTDLRSMTLAQTIAHCRMQWLAGHWDQAPLAFAWHKDGLDWYVMDGADTASMRYFYCNGSGVEHGARYPRAFASRLPTKSAPIEPRTVMFDINLFDYFASLPNQDWQGLEAAQDPADPVKGELLQRRWLADGSVELIQPDAIAFPRLISAAPSLANNATYQALTPMAPLTATNWLKNPDAVFALLAEQLAPSARIVEMGFNEKYIGLHIAGPIANSEGRPPAPFGEGSFDEYGIRNNTWFYPRDTVNGACANGHTLAEVKALFAARTNAQHPQPIRAEFHCGVTSKVSTAGSVGSWKVSVPRQRGRLFNQ